jgi:hypothetical protein
MTTQLHPQGHPTFLSSRNQAQHTCKKPTTQRICSPFRVVPPSTPRRDGQGRSSDSFIIPIESHTTDHRLRSFILFCFLLLSCFLVSLLLVSPTPPARSAAPLLLSLFLPLSLSFSICSPDPPTAAPIDFFLRLLSFPKHTYTPRQRSPRKLPFPFT